MFEHLRPTDSVVWTIVWQSSSFLALGLAASLALRKRPARAHWVLLSAMLAALVSPALTETGRRLGWGLWATPSPVVETVIPSTNHAPIAPAFDRPAPPPAAFPEVPRSVEVAPIAEPTAHWVALPSFSWRAAFLIGWAAASLWLFAKLIVSFVGGWRLARSARKVDDANIRAWVEAAAERLGLRAVPRVGRLSAVRCPAIWCWGRRPLLLLPENGEAEGVDWAGVFRHELAHWSRRDHISTLVGEVLVCALPWHPLAWWSRGRLAQLAELACDDWVLAGGVSPSDYAESLLALTPQRRSSALAAVSSRRGLMARVRRILTEARREPTLGARWTLVVCLGLLTAVSALALAQARPAKAKANDGPEEREIERRALREAVRRGLREAVQRTVCVDNLRRIGQALSDYHGEHGHLPGNIVDKSGKPLLSWRVAILPLVDERELYNKFKLDEPWDSPHNKLLLDSMPEFLHCPSRPQSEPALTHYLGFEGKRALFEKGAKIKFEDVRDGTSDTIAVVEAEEGEPWTKPSDLPFDENETAPTSHYGAGSKHPDGFEALKADGSTRFIKKSISPAVLKALITRNGGEVLSPDAY